MHDKEKSAVLVYKAALYKRKSPQQNGVQGSARNQRGNSIGITYDNIDIIS